MGEVECVRRRRRKREEEECEGESRKRKVGGRVRIYSLYMIKSGKERLT